MAIVYLHKRNDTGKVFYVGIGNSKSRAFSKYGRNEYWKRITNKYGYQIIITHENLIREEACCIEKYLIAFYNEIGGNKLTNMTKGGDGSDTETAIKNNIIRWSDLEQRKRLSELNKKRFENEEERKKISEANKKRFENEEERKKVSEANKKRFSIDANKEMMKQSTTNFWKNLSDEKKAEIKAKMKASANKRWSNVNEKNRFSEICKKRLKNENEREKYRQSSLTFWKNLSDEKKAEMKKKLFKKK